MKPIFQKPRFGLTSTAAWSFVLGLFLIVAGLLNLPGTTLIAIGSVFLLIGVLIWQEVRLGLWVGLIVFGLLTALHATRVFTDFHWRYLIYFLAFAQLTYECWQGLRQLNEMGHPSGEEANGEDADDNKAMTSLVLLQREQKYLEDMVLTKLVESTWGGDYSSAADDDDEAEEHSGDGFVVGENPLYVIKAPTGMYLVHNFDTPYWEDKDEVVEAIGELRLRKAIEDHNAWLSVDLISPADEQPDLAKAYLQLARLLVELADENTLAVLRPESMDINVWSDEVAERLLTPGAYEELSQPDNVPVIPISDDDPAMKAAVATAQSRWPEFVSAYQQAGGSNPADEDSKFVVKAKITVDDSTEFIWVDVIGLEPKYVHGTLANDPVDLGDLQLGSQVEFPIEDVCDWCYFEDEEPVGLFSLEAINEVQRRSDDT